jgi:CheY-like chemotaxis protein
MNAQNKHAPPLILVADDERAVADLIAVLLRKAGCRVVTGHDGQWALDSARQLGPDLAILNNIMPLLCGVEVARKLREDPKTAKIKLIVTSMSPQAGPLAQREGADAFLQTPFHPDDLRQLVEKLLARP